MKLNFKKTKKQKMIHEKKTEFVCDICEYGENIYDEEIKKRCAGKYDLYIEFNFCFNIFL